MNIVLQKSVSFSEIGKKFKNEDSIYPKNKLVNSNNRLFLVCDGVEGSNRGEVASTIACDSIQTYFHTFLETEKNINPEFIENSIRYTEICFDEYLRKNASAKGMATSLCFLYVAPNGIFLAHVGGCRIYQFRKGKIIYKTEDHSVVNSMIQIGLLNPLNVEKHPQRNMVYRTIQGSHNPVELNIVKITDILPDDEFFMCTNGITEALTDEMLCQIFSTNDSSEKKIETIRECCRYNTKDNYSACIIPILKTKKMNVFKQIYFYVSLYLPL